MNKPCRRDTSLCERDALKDIYLQERTLLRAYADAAAAGERSLRQEVAALFAEAAEDAAAVLAALGGEVLSRGEMREHFEEQKKQLKACFAEEQPQ